MKKIIAFNWKMSPSSLKEAEQIIKIFQNPRSMIHDPRLIICPPFIFLQPLSKLLKTKNSKLKIHLGAQDVFWAKQGAFTGEISASMLKNLGVKYVIIGHSERRKWQNETDEIINKKIKIALETGLKIILCVGENLSVRKKGIKFVKQFIKSQLQKDLSKLCPYGTSREARQTTNYKLQTNLIVAYEPIWAIGTGNYCDPKDAVEVVKFIKQTLNPKVILNSKVLYGGSVNSKNIKDYLKYKEIDGVLVGGASVDKKELKLILKNLNAI